MTSHQGLEAMSVEKPTRAWTKKDEKPSKAWTTPQSLKAMSDDEPPMGLRRRPMTSGPTVISDDSPQWVCSNKQ